MVNDPMLLLSPTFGGSDCERIVGGALAQPVLALTSLAYVAAGAHALLASLRSRSRLVTAGAAVVVAVGAGSFVFHGPQPSWAEPVHDAPIYALAALLGAGALTRRPPPRAWVLPGAWFAAALATYPLGRTDSPLCAPDALWQWHGLWHVLSAVAAGYAVRRLLGETDTAESC